MPRNKSIISGNKSLVTRKKSSNSPSLLGQIGSNILTGFSFGTGSAIAHRAIGGISNQIPDESKLENNKITTNNPSISCQILLEDYQSCLKENDKFMCQEIKDKLLEKC